MSDLVVVAIQGDINADLKALLLEADPDWNQVQQYLVHAQLYGIYVQETCIAQICIVSVTQQQIEIKNLSVSKQHRQRGLAKKLMQYAIQQAKTQGKQGVWIKTGNSSLDQLALYQKMGFRMQHIEKDVFLHYPEPIYENGIRCLDQVVLYMSLG